MGAAHTPVLWETNSAVRKELPRFNLISGGLNKLAKFPTLLFINDCLQILNLGCILAHENNQSNTGDPRHPGIANQLRIECEKTLRLLRVAAGRRFPVDNALCRVQFADRINVRKEVAPRWK